MNSWLDLKRAAEYCSLSVRTLRRYVGDPVRPLPVRVVGGKFLIRAADLDTWLASFPRAHEDLDKLMDDLVQEVRGGKPGTS
jgi:hypothetical protein